jgi:hypothetical protein
MLIIWKEIFGAFGIPSKIALIEMTLLMNLGVKQ